MMAPVSLPEAAKSETSSTSVDMAGRIFHFWLQDEGDQEFMCTNIKYNSHVLHDPSDEKDDESDKDSVDEPFDVINDMKKNKTSPHKINSPAQPPRRLARLTKYLDTSTIWSGTTDAQTVGDASQSDHVSASSLNDIMTTNVDSSHQFESTSDPGHPNSDFHRRLNHRRRLQRIRQLEESGDEATKTTPLHSYGAPPQSPTSEDEATDTTSVHSNGARPQSPTNLQDRSLQAWRSSMKTLQSKKNINTVSFGEQNKVHHLEPAMTDESSRWTEDKSEVTSVQSEYSKTDASEVEDAIKDIFFLGDGKKSRPGRRKRSDRNLENGIIKQGATTFVKQQKLKAQSTKRRSATKASDAPMAAVWQMMEGGMTGLVSALGISPSVDENDEESKVDQRSETSKFQTYVIPRDKEEHIPSIDLGSCPSGSTSGEDNMTKTGISVQSAANSTLEKSEPMGDEEQNELTEILEGFPFPLSSLDTDPDFAKLAFLAARSVHQLRGVKFDQSYLLDMYSDLKVSVVELKIPLGLILMENEGGCFVFKIAPDGSAARSGGVEAGDQLAAINGQKSLKMKVDDIYNGISDSPDPVVVQLAFIRYIGPFHSDGPPVSTSESKTVVSEPRSTLRVIKDKTPSSTTGKKKRRNWFKRRRGWAS